MWVHGKSRLGRWAHRPMAEPHSEAVSAGPNTAPCVWPEPGEGAPRQCQDVTPICCADAHVVPNIFTRGQRGPPNPSPKGQEFVLTSNIQVSFIYPDRKIKALNTWHLVFVVPVRILTKRKRMAFAQGLPVGSE